MICVVVNVDIGHGGTHPVGVRQGDMNPDVSPHVGVAGTAQVAIPAQNQGNIQARSPSVRRRHRRSASSDY